MGVTRSLARWALRLGFGVLVATVIAVLYFSHANFRRYGDGRALDAPVDAVLVLGGGVDGDGVLGYSSRRRVAAAVALLVRGKTRFLVFSGGEGSFHREVPAGDLMRTYAISIGAPADALIVEPSASTTFENLRFGLDIARQRGFTRLAILTDAYHLERARWLARFLGAGDAQLVAVAGLERDGLGDRTWSILREALAWWLNLAKVAGWEALSLAGLGDDARGELIR